MMTSHWFCTLVFQVLEAWKNLLEAAEGRRLKLVDTGDKFRFFSMVRDLMLWMEDVIRLIEAQENPRSDPVCCSKYPKTAKALLSTVIKTNH